MSSILPKIKTKFGENLGVEIVVSPPDLETESTFITTDAASGVSSLSVDNGLKFATSEYVLIGNWGAEKSEIIRISTSTSPTATTMTLNSATQFAHNRGERIKFIPYNQIAIQRSTDAGVNYSALTTLDIRPDATETYYNDTGGLSTYYYRARFSNSASALTSEFSSPTIATGLASNSAGAIIREALVSLGEKIDESVLTKEFLFSAFNEGRDEIDKHAQVERWSFRTAFNYDAGDMIPGRFQITLPTDLRDSSTAKNILSVRLGKDKIALISTDKTALNRWYQGIAHTTLNGAVLASATSIVLTSSGDFEESGSVDIAAESISESIDAAAYTSNTESTATLGTVTGIGVNHATLRDVWQNATFGVPTEYTVFDDLLTFDRPFSDEVAGENIWLDYYQKITEITAEGDLLDEPFFKIYIPYLRYRIKLRKNRDLKREEDDDWKSWVEKKNAQVQKEFLGQDIRIKVDVPI